MPLVDSGSLVREAYRNRYAIVQVNTNGGTYDLTRAIVETAEAQITRSRITITGFQTGKGVVADKSIKEKFASLNFKNIKFQFNRVVRSKLPF